MDLQVKISEIQMMILNKIYEKSYKGFISYDNQNLLFNKSKINIESHEVNNAPDVI